jgi:FtsH-binding integral membrane protein
MANGFDPRATVSAQPATTAGRAGVAIDAGLRSYMLSVYNYMASGVLLTGVIAMLIGQTNAISYLIDMSTGRPTVLWYIATFAPLALVFWLNFGLQRMATSTAQAIFWAYAALLGVSLATLFVTYTDVSIARTFFATAAAFGGLSLWGYTTKRDLSAMGTFLIMGLIGLLVAMVINLFLQSSAFELAISAIGVLIFAGLTAYDTQKIKSLYFQVSGSEMAGKFVIMGALQLYLDFLNMFLFLLRFMGNRD